jgi:hypothetical protein
MTIWFGTRTKEVFVRFSSPKRKENLKRIWAVGNIIRELNPDKSLEFCLVNESNLNPKVKVIDLK